VVPTPCAAPLQSAPLAGLKVVSIALNLPGPAACFRLAQMGASLSKIEPPTGDPLEGYCAPWYRILHAGAAIHRIDLKSDAGKSQAMALLAEADLLVTAQRPSALARLGIAWPALHARFPNLCQIAIVGHAAPGQDLAGHDLTYQAAAGLLSPPALPATLYADMAGAERAASAALALLVQRSRSNAGGFTEVALAEAADWLALPRKHGMTLPGALIGGGYAGYNLYLAKKGWVAVAALEPHFAARLAKALGFAALATDTLAARFLAESAEYWQAWALQNDLPIVAVPDLPPRNES
jgi:alpha-methylacyl-CoA racemase